MSFPSSQAVAALRAAMRLQRHIVDLADTPGASDVNVKVTLDHMDRDIEAVRAFVAGMRPLRPDGA